MDFFRSACHILKKSPRAESLDYAVFWNGFWKKKKKTSIDKEGEKIGDSPYGVGSIGPSTEKRLTRDFRVARSRAKNRSCSKRTTCPRQLAYTRQRHGERTYVNFNIIQEPSIESRSLKPPLRSWRVARISPSIVAKCHAECRPLLNIRLTGINYILPRERAVPIPTTRAFSPRYAKRPSFSPRTRTKITQMCVSAPLLTLLCWLFDEIFYDVRDVCRRKSSWRG